MGNIARDVAAAGQVRLDFARARLRTGARRVRASRGRAGGAAFPGAVAKVTTMAKVTSHVARNKTSVLIPQSAQTPRGKDMFNDKQSQVAERKTGDGRGPGDHSREAG